MTTPKPPYMTVLTHDDKQATFPGESEEHVWQYALRLGLEVKAVRRATPEEAAQYEKTSSGRRKKTWGKLEPKATAGFCPVCHLTPVEGRKTCDHCKKKEAKKQAALKELHKRKKATP